MSEWQHFDCCPRPHRERQFRNCPGWTETVARLERVAPGRHHSAFRRSLDIMLAANISVWVNRDTKQVMIKPHYVEEPTRPRDLTYRARLPGSRPKMSATSPRGRSFGETGTPPRSVVRRSLRRPASPTNLLPPYASPPVASEFFVLSQSGEFNHGLNRIHLDRHDFTPTG